MAFTYGFYNSFNHDRKYDAIQFGQIFDGIIKDGVYATYKKALLVKASNNSNEVIVQPGRAWFNHTWSYNDADLPIEAPQPEVLLDRLDTLVLDINSEEETRANSIIWVQGTPTSQVPQRANLIHTVTHNQYPLCDVYRKAGTTQIYAGDIRNRIGSSDCPFVTGVLEAIDIDTWLNLWNTAFDEMIDRDESEFSNLIESDTDTFSQFMIVIQHCFQDLNRKLRRTFLIHRQHGITGSSIMLMSYHLRKLLTCRLRLMRLQIYMYLEKQRSFQEQECQLLMKQPFLLFNSQSLEG